MNTYTMADLRAAEKLCDPKSPLERVLLRALMDHCWPSILDPDVDGNILADHPHMRLRIQERKHRYTADFGLHVRAPGLGELSVAIECDGHAFHDQTKEDAARDRTRDRHFQGIGWLIARFPGWQVNANPRWCAERVADMVTDAYAHRVKMGAETLWRQSA